MNSPDYYAGLEALGIVKCVRCSEADQIRFKELRDSELPENVFYDGSGNNRRFMCYTGAVMSRENLNDLVLVRNALNIKTIKSCVIFFVVIAVISLVITVFTAVLF